APRGRRSRRLPSGRARLHPLVSARARRACPGREPTRPNCRPPGRHAGSDRAGLAPAPIARHAPDSRDVVARPSRGERRRRRDRARRRRAGRSRRVSRVLTAPVAAARVVVLGSANVDFVVRLARRPEPGETVLAREHRVVAGGKGANQAVAAARAGAEVAFVGRVGDDAYGADVLAGLAAAGIDVTHLEIQRGAVTGAAFITVTPDGENAIVVSAGANGALDPNAVDAAREAIGAAAVLAVQLEVPLSAVEHACRLAGEAGTQVVLSAAPAIPAACRLVPLADILVCNLGEVRLLADAPS